MDQLISTPLKNLCRPVVPTPAPITHSKVQPFGNGTHDLLKVALLLPDENLSPNHQAKINAMFKKRQRQRRYRRTACNLARRANQNCFG
jgi:hypothetical protein